MSMVVNAGSEIGAYLRRVRSELRITQRELEKAWGKSQTTVSDIENGKRGVEKDDIPALARALGRSIQEVTRAAGYVTDPHETIEDMVLEVGKTVTIKMREGDPGTSLRLTTQALAVLNALALTDESTKKAA